MPVTDAQRVDIRRYAGYPVYTPLGSREQDSFLLELCLDRMSDNETAVLTTTMLPALATLEAAIAASSDNLDTDQAAVWYHNKDEVADRTALYNLKRRDLCAFIGVRSGSGLGQGGAIIRT